MRCNGVNDGKKKVGGVVEGILEVFSGGANIGRGDGLGLGDILGKAFECTCTFTNALVTTKLAGNHVNQMGCMAIVPSHDA